MANKKTARRALFSSVLALILCCCMLVGTTFAWFTDSVTSANNIIKSGTLDVTMEWMEGTEDPATGTWTDASTGEIFNYDKWEPGYTEVRHIKIANVGNLALKYQLQIVANGEVSNLADVIDVYYVDPAVQVANRTDLNDSNKLGTLTEALSGMATTANGNLLPKDANNSGEVTLTIALKMQESAGNEYQNKSIGTDFSVKLYATQYTFEGDSFDELYDENAPLWNGTTNIDWYLEDPDATEFVLTSGEELAGLAAIVNGTAVPPATTFAAGENTIIKDDFKGKTIKLGNDINLCDIKWTPIGDNANPFRGNFDGQGHTVSNLFVSNEGWAGLIGHAGLSAPVTISNLTVNGVTIHSNRMAGAVVGQLYGNIDNCHVKNATIMVTPNAVGDSYDNGDKVGGIVGWLGDNGNNRTISNCSATKVQLGAYRDVGGIVGYVASSTTVKNNTVSDITITVDQTTNYYGDKDVNAGYIFGRNNGISVDENNTNDANCAINSTYSKNGMTLKGDGDGKVVLYLVPETYTNSTVNVPEGVTVIGNYAFAYNTNVENVVLASTVRDLGRGFDSSAVKKVVLNEGLETISSRAFRSTTALEEVVIPTTVMTIADNAFQKSAIKEIVIPATVKTIGETAFGSSKIEKVTFEGNTSIQGYAFRGCPNLREVYLKGDDVTFIASTLNGRNSCWFCNGESNNPNTSNINFYVVNETVAARVKTAMGAEAANTPVYVNGFLYEG